MKQLIISSDDYGVCHSVNEGVVRGFTEGILTQASIMVPCPWFEESVALAKEHGIPVGIHLTATCEWDHYRWRPLTGGRSLMYDDGTLPRSVEEVCERADLDELEEEYVAQVELVRARGLEPCFVDVHMHIVDRDFTARVLRRIGLRTRQTLGAGNEDCCFGLASRRSLTNETRDPERDKTEWLRELIEGLGEGSHFVCCHLAERSSELRSMSSTESSWAEAFRVTDLDAIVSPGLRELCEEHGVELASLADFVD